MPGVLCSEFSKLVVSIRPRQKSLFVCGVSSRQSADAWWGGREVCLVSDILIIPLQGDLAGCCLLPQQTLKAESGLQRSCSEKSVKLTDYYSSCCPNLSVQSALLTLENLWKTNTSESSRACEGPMGALAWELAAGLRSAAEKSRLAPPLCSNLLSHKPSPAAGGGHSIGKSPPRSLKCHPLRTATSGGAWSAAALNN